MHINRELAQIEERLHRSKVEGQIEEYVCEECCDFMQPGEVFWWSDCGCDFCSLACAAAYFKEKE